MEGVSVEDAAAAVGVVDMGWRVFSLGVSVLMVPMAFNTLLSQAEGVLELVWRLASHLQKSSRKLLINAVSLMKNYF
jgi:hypothetical protein